MKRDVILRMAAVFLGACLMVGCGKEPAEEETQAAESVAEQSSDVQESVSSGQDEAVDGSTQAELAEDTETDAHPEVVLDTFDDLTGDQLYAAALLYREKEDFATALQFMHEAFDRGCDDALVEVAAWYFVDKAPLADGQDNNEEAIKLMNLATDRDNAMAAYYWGIIYAGGGFPALEGGADPNVIAPDMDKAIEYYEESIELGYNKAFKFLGNMYVNGEYGVEADVEKGVSYYKMGAEKEDFTCTHLYADCLYNGTGVEQDVEEAMRLYQWLVDVQAHNKNDYAWGAYMLGKIYDEGVYVTKDDEKAKSYYELAASLGNEEAQEALN